ncbi:transposase [Flavobacterium covae]|nr:transposase [Flavobacterium covae]
MPKSVVEYLGRYTHKIAISNHRTPRGKFKKSNF